jgi:hypothetical protein
MVGIAVPCSYLASCGSVDMNVYFGYLVLQACVLLAWTGIRCVPDEFAEKLGLSSSSVDSAAKHSNRSVSRRSREWRIETV